jgi:hypothetical protein
VDSILRLLEDPSFLSWLEANHKTPIEPEEQDWVPIPQDSPDEVVAEALGIARTRKLVRLYMEWRARSPEGLGGPQSPQTS